MSAPKATTCSEAINNFCKLQEPPCNPEDLEKCELFFEKPPIERMDPSLSKLKKCTQLTLSSNNIDKISHLNGLQLKIFSIGRNAIRKLDGIEAVKDTLEQVWCSHNPIDKLTVLVNYQFPKLKKIYCACCNIASWTEVENLTKIENLEEVSFAGNNLPNYSPMEVFNRLPKLFRVDGFSLEQLQKKTGVTPAGAE